jgi:DHA1 family bicyclomycin/chloramphenicol resistance-like MFS transporter
VVLLGALTAFSAISTDLFLPGLPARASDFKATPAQAELTVAAFFVGLAIGQPIYGPLSDRVGRRGPLLGGIALYVAASIGCVLATTIEALIAFRVAQALGGCAGVVIARAVVRDKFPPQQTAQLFSTLVLVMGLAPILAPLAGGVIITLAGWRATLWVLTAFGIACGLAVLFTLKESRPEAVAIHARSESPIRSYVAILKQPRLMGYVAFGSLNTAALVTYIVTGPDLLIRVHHVPVAAFGWVFGLNGAGMVAASQINVRISRRFGYERVLGWASMGSVGAAVWLTVVAVTGWGGLPGLLAPLFFVIASFGFSMGNALAGALAVDPHRAGATAGLLGCLQFVVGSTAAVIAGALHDGTARPTAFVIVAAFLIGAAALRLLAKPGSTPAQA